MHALEEGRGDNRVRRGGDRKPSCGQGLKEGIMKALNGVLTRGGLFVSDFAFVVIE